MPDLSEARRDLRTASSEVVLDREVLAAHHSVPLEPLAAELLGGSVGGVGPGGGNWRPQGAHHSIVMRSLLMSSWLASKVSQETAISTDSLGSSTPHGGSTPRRRAFVVLIAQPMRWPPALWI